MRGLIFGFLAEVKPDPGPSAALGDFVGDYPGLTLLGAGL
jgi:hypothetical protein